MLVSVISDTHDNMPYIKKAVKRLNAISPDLVIHCGDFSAPFAVTPYVSLRSPMTAVYGNNDAERDLIRQKLEQAGKKVQGSFARLTFDGRKMAVTHGDNLDLVDSVIESGGFDIVLYGHTHQMHIEEKGEVMIINPGEVCGYLSGKHTFVTYDTATYRARIARL